MKHDRRTDLTGSEIHDLQTGAGDPYHFEYDIEERDPEDGAWERWAVPLALVLGLTFWAMLWSLAEPYLP